MLLQYAPHGIAIKPTTPRRKQKIEFLTDKALRQIKGKKFRKKTGITKADYRFLRNLMLSGFNFESITFWRPGDKNNKPYTLHQFCQKFRGIDVIYITRIQKERINTKNGK